MRNVFKPLVGCLRDGVPVSLSRWGDGEWHAILGHPGQNCDGQVYKAGLRAALTRVLLDRPTYWLGLQPLAVKLMGPDIGLWLQSNHLTIDWVNGDCLADASQAGILPPFARALGARRTLLVGPPHLGRLLIPLVGHVLVPMRNAWARYPDIERRVLSAIAETDADVVIVSAGMSAKLLVHAITQTTPTVSAIDCGSLWEPYVGLATRSYHAAVLAREQAHV